METCLISSIKEIQNTAIRWQDYGDHLLYSDYIDGLMSFDVDASHLKTIPGPGGHLMQLAHL